MTWRMRFYWGCIGWKRVQKRKVKNVNENEYIDNYILPNMLQYVLAAFCFLWFIRVWICVCGAPYRLTRKMISVIFHFIETIYTKTSNVAKYARVQRKKPTENTDGLE